MKTSNKTVSETGFYGEFGGVFIPKMLEKSIAELTESYHTYAQSKAFRQEYNALLKDYVGRPSPLYHSAHLSNKYGA
ncbi:MAG: tryptophan synthase subunit beta, partial [Mucinivorans sp.]